jgi:hypothetical protein
MRTTLRNHLEKCINYLRGVSGFETIQKISIDTGVHRSTVSKLFAKMSRKKSRKYLMSSLVQSTPRSKWGVTLTELGRTTKMSKILSDAGYPSHRRYERKKEPIETEKKIRQMQKRISVIESRLNIPHS